MNTETWLELKRIWDKLRELEKKIDELKVEGWKTAKSVETKQLKYWRVKKGEETVAWFKYEDSAIDFVEWNRTYFGNYLKIEKVVKDV